MLSNSRVQGEANKVIKQVEDFWGENVGDIQIMSITDTPFDMFTLQMVLYKNYTVFMEYERSTLAFGLKSDGQYIYLDELTNESIYKGFKSYYPENMLHNFKVLDEIIKSMNSNA